MDVGDYYSRSVNDFKENLNIAIPSLVGIVLTFVIVILAVLIGVFGAYFSSINANLAAPNLAVVAIFVLLIGIAVILSLFISSFIYAATIGMVKKIIEGKRPDLNVAWKYGKKYFLNILAVIIIMSILYLLLAIPAFLGLILLNFSSTIGLVILVIGIIILIAGAIIMTLALMVVNQAIVVGEKSIIGAIKDSYKVFMKNKMQVFLVGLINFVIGLAVSSLGFIPYVGWFLNIIAEIVLIPFFALVVTYLYMDLKGKLPQYEY
jgi:hypothetical protein